MSALTQARYATPGRAPNLKQGLLLSVPCPTCSAAAGELCVTLPPERRDNASHKGIPGGQSKPNPHPRRRVMAVRKANAELVER